MFITPIPAKSDLDGFWMVWWTRATLVFASIRFILVFRLVVDYVWVTCMSKTVSKMKFDSWVSWSLTLCSLIVHAQFVSTLYHRMLPRSPHTHLVSINGPLMPQLHPAHHLPSSSSSSWQDSCVGICHHLPICVPAETYLQRAMMCYGHNLSSGSTATSFLFVLCIPC